jgi:hypothetical protein
MAIRSTRLITKNTLIPSQTLPSSGVLQGEALVNLGDGILFFSGGTAGSPTWVPSDNPTAGYFEVGSNLYNLKLRNRIVGYEGQTDVTGKFLSGTTSGFTLADISDIQGVDTYVTGFTYNPSTNIFTISRNQGQPDINLFVNEFSGLTIGDLNVTGTITGIDHNTDLEGLQGGQSGQYYHVNSTLYDALTGASSPSSSNVFATLADLTAGSGDTKEVKVSSNDSTPGFLEDKLTGSTYINTTTLNDGGNEVVQISLDKTELDSDYDSRFVNTSGDTITGELVINGTLTATTFYSGNTDLITVIESFDTFATGGTVTQFANDDSNEVIVEITGNNGFGSFDITGLTDTFATGLTFSSNTITLEQNDGTDLSVSLDTIELGSILSGVTFDIATTGSISASAFSGGTFYGDGSNLTGITDSYVTGLTYSNNTISLTQNGDGSNYSVTIDAVTGLTINGDLVVTGDTTLNVLSATTIYSGGTDLATILSELDTVTAFTYNPTTNTFTIDVTDGSFDASINTVSGLTVSNLTSGRVVYVGASGLLTDEAGFEYNDITNLLTVGNIFVNNPSGTTANIGQGGLVIGSGGSSSTPGIGDLVVHGDLTVFGDTTTISTSELYIEDPQITLNYNPTGDTSVTSIGSGILIQDGGGVTGQDVKIGVGQLFGSSISGDTSEYTATTGFENRGWITQLNDIVIRNSSPVNFGDPDGVRVLTEHDILDGGSY